MGRLFRQMVSVATASSLLAATLVPTFAAGADTAAVKAGAPLPANCQVADEEAFRNAIDSLTFAAITKGMEGVDYNALVNISWRETGADLALEQRVTKSVAEVQEETSWSTLLQSLASKEAAQALATSVAERTYRSEEMNKAIEAVAADVGKQIAGRIELATLDAAAPAVACVRAFLGPRYGASVSLLVADDTGKAFQQTAAAGSADVNNTDLAIQSKGLIAGAVILVVRKALANLAKRIGQRVVGAVLGKIVSVVAGGIGLILIAKDIWDMRAGILPLIDAEMRSDDTKSKVKAEIALAISEQLQTHLKDISAGTADRILQVWHEFKAAHAKVLELAEKLPPFKTFLDTVAVAQLPRVDRVVALVLSSEGEGGVAKRLSDGTLDEAAKRMPDAVLDIATDTRSLDEAIGWQQLAGSQVGKVSANELHRIAKPKDFTVESLKQLLSLDDKFAVTRIGALPRDLREAVGSMTPERQRSLSRSLGSDEFNLFAGYVQGLKRNAAVRLISAVADDPTRMKQFSQATLQQAVLNSRDQEAAVGLMLRDGALFNFLALQQDFDLVTSGDVSPLLLWYKHTAAVSTGLGGGALLLLMIFRLFGGRRRR
jgi:hypothetical protein